MSTPTPAARRRRNPGAAALDRVNAQRAPDPGFTLWVGRAHIRAGQRAAWEAMTAKQRGYLIAAALDDPATRNVATLAEHEAALEGQPNTAKGQRE